LTNNKFPSSIREINDLDKDAKESIYRTLIPDWIYRDIGIDNKTLTKNGHRVVSFRYPQGSRALEITVKNEAKDIDPVMYLHLADTFTNQLLVLLVQVNDPTAPRFNTDRDEEGNITNFGTVGRNIPAELAAMEYGLAPGQIRPGLRSFRRTVPIFEEFVANMGHDLFFIEPLAYHNAIVFERYGFNYLRGLNEMRHIDTQFRPDGEYFQRLNDNNPFRTSSAWRSIRGRSWAIHDGILGHPFTGFQMYKRIGKDSGVNTFENAVW